MDTHTHHHRESATTEHSRLRTHFHSGPARPGETSTAPFSVSSSRSLRIMTPPCDCDSAQRPWLPPAGKYLPLPWVWDTDGYLRDQGDLRVTQTELESSTAGPLLQPGISCPGPVRHGGAGPAVPRGLCHPLCQVAWPRGPRLKGSPLTHRALLTVWGAAPRPTPPL